MPRWPLLAVAWVSALNLRLGLLALAPVLPLLSASLHLSHAQGQFVFALPLVLMGLLSLPGGLLADRVGTRTAVAVGLAMIAAGELARASAGDYGSLLAWTAVFGAGIGIAQPALPKLVKERFASQATLATGLYTTGLVFGATIGAWLTVPWLVTVSGGWRGCFTVWGCVGVAGLVTWLIAWPRDRRRHGHPALADPLAAWRIPGVARVAALYLCQSIAFYTLSAWMPTYLHELGWPLARTQLPYGLFQAVAIPCTALVSWLMQRLGRRRGVTVASAITFLAGILGLTFLPDRLTLLWSLLAGASNTAPLVLAMALPVELAGGDQVASVTGVVLTVGYAGAIAGPPLAGLLRDVTGLPVAGMIPAIAGALALIVASLRVPEAPRTAAPS